MSKNRHYVKPILDVAILTAGRADLFDKCVDALLPQLKKEYRVYVCNNGHPSQEYEETYKKLPENSIIKRNNSDGGFSVGANTAIRGGNAPIIFFITDDVFVHDGVIETLIKVMADKKTVGQCGYKFIFPEDSSDPQRPAGKVQHIGMASNIRGEMIHPLIGWSPDNQKCCISREVMAVTGASFMVRRDVFSRAGGFNPIYGKGYFEDMDLSFTVRSQGSGVYVCADAVATHGVGQTFKNSEHNTRMLLQQNQMIFRGRWLNQMQWSEWEMW